MRGHTDKQRLFVAEYMKDLNVTRAARQQGQRLLTNIAVREERAADLMGELLFGARNAREIDE